MCPYDRLPRVETVAFWNSCSDRVMQSSSTMALVSHSTRKRRELERKSFELFRLRQTVQRNLIRGKKILIANRTYSVFMANEWNILDVADEMSGHLRDWSECIFNDGAHHFASIVGVSRNVYHLKQKRFQSLYRRSKIIEDRTYNSAA